MTDNRRVDDARITRIEETVNAIQAKINNGLTERTLRNTQHIEELVEKHNDFELKVEKQLVEYKVYASQQVDEMIEIKETLATLAGIQKGWSRAVNTFLFTLVGVMGSGMIFLLANADKISQIMKHLTEL